MPHISTSLEPYEQILFEDLRIPEEFLRKHEKTLNEKLCCAAADMDREGRQDDAVNQCMHLACSIVMENRIYLGETLERLRSMRVFERMEPSFVLSVAALYYLLRGETQRQIGEVQKREIERMRRLFNDKNWLIGRNAMRALGFGSGTH